MGRSASALTVESVHDHMAGPTCPVLDDGLVHVGERGLWLPMGSAQRTRSRTAIGLQQVVSGHCYFLKVHHFESSITDLISQLVTKLDSLDGLNLSREQLKLRVEAMSGYQVELLASDPIDESSWEIDAWWKLHIGLLAASRIGLSLTELKQQAEIDRSSVAWAIATHVHRIKALAPQASGALPNIDGMSWVTLSNYLNCRSVQTRRNRSQAASLFPLLVSQILLESEHTPWSIGLAETIDAGRPLISYLAEQLGVKPVAIKAIRNLDVSDVGIFWKDRVRELLWLISDLPPEHYPVSRAQWDVFAQQIQCQMSLGKHPVCCTANKILAAALARRHWQPLVDISTSFLEEANLLDQFRDDLIAAAKSVSALQAEIDGQSAPEINIYQAVAGTFATLGFRTCLSWARKWRVFPRPVNSIGDTGDFPVLLKAPFGNGVLSVTQLMRQAELDAESAEMNNCVSTYATTCRRGRSLIFAVRDRSGRSLSNLELSIQRQGFQKFSIQVVQHVGSNNRAPGKAAIEMVEAFMVYLKSEAANLILHDFFQQKVLSNLEPSVKRNLGMAKVLDEFLAITAKGRVSLASIINAGGTNA